MDKKSRDTPKDTPARLRCYSSSSTGSQNDEAIYFEHKGKDSGIVRFTFEQLEGLKIVEEEEEQADSPQ